MMRSVCMLFGCLFVSSAAFAQEWYQGGTLHRSTVAQWQTAVERNKVATASDWIAGLEQSGQIGLALPKTSKEAWLGALRVHAIQVATCVDGAIPEGAPGSLSAAEIGAMCIMLMYPK